MRRWKSRVTVALVATATVACSGNAFRSDGEHQRASGGGSGDSTVTGRHTDGGASANGSGGQANGNGGSPSTAEGAPASGGTGGAPITPPEKDAGGAAYGTDHDAGRSAGGSANGGSSGGDSSNGGTASGGTASGGTASGGTASGGMASGGRTAIGGSGGSGAGGAAAVSAPPSWVTSLTAAYFFEGSSTTLGNEANGHAALNLVGGGTSAAFFPSRDTTTFIQGASSAKLDGASDGTERTLFASALPEPAALQTPPGTSFTMGGWYRIDPSRTADQEWLLQDVGPGAYTGGNVLALDQTPLSTSPVRGRFSDGLAEAYCKVGSSDESSNYVGVRGVGADARAPAGGWVHVICRHDAVANRLAVFVAGVLSAQIASPGVGPGRGPFMIGYDDGEYGAFVGSADDVFFTRAALTDEQIHRIYACGIDGARCRCQAEAPTKYAACGFAQAGGTACPATSLTPCNATLAAP